LIVVAVLNLLLSLYMMVSGIFAANMPDDQYEAQLTAIYPPEMKEKLRQQAGSVQDMKRMSLAFGVGVGGGGTLLSLLTVFGAIRMMGLKSYALAVFVSVLAAIPCISCTACCGLGEGVGIWALVVLLNPEVRAAFR
jgi:hypothetical protein